MYLIPFLQKEGFDWIFMSDGGKRIWEGDGTVEEIVKMYFNDNGLWGSVVSCKKDVLLFEVNEETSLSAFYTTLEDVPSDVHAWRPFFWIEGADPERRQTSLGSFGSAAKLGEVLGRT
jgi:hypothetical protein